MAKQIKVTQSVKAEDGTVQTTDVDTTTFRDEALKLWETHKPNIDLTNGENAARYLMLALDDESCPYEALLALAACGEDSIAEAACNNAKADAAVELARTKGQLQKKINQKAKE